MNTGVWALGLTLSTAAFALGFSATGMVLKEPRIDRVTVLAMCSAALSLTSLAMILLIGANQ